VNALGIVCGAAAIPNDECLAVVLKFAEIVHWPDADDPGDTLMRRIGARLLALGLPPDRLRWLEPARAEGLEKEGADAADLDDDGIRDALDAAVGAMPKATTTPAEPSDRTWDDIRNGVPVSAGAETPPSMNANPSEVHVESKAVDANDRVEVDANAPFKIADELLKAKFELGGIRTLHHHQGSFWLWDRSHFKQTSELPATVGKAQRSSSRPPRGTCEMSATHSRHGPSFHRIPSHPFGLELPTAALIQ
jgi:hypothetical protein